MKNRYLPDPWMREKVKKIFQPKINHININLHLKLKKTNYKKVVNDEAHRIHRLIINAYDKIRSDDLIVEPTLNNKMRPDLIWNGKIIEIKNIDLKVAKNSSPVQMDYIYQLVHYYFQLKMDGRYEVVNSFIISLPIYDIWVQVWFKPSDLEEVYKKYKKLNKPKPYKYTWKYFLKYFTKYSK